MSTYIRFLVVHILVQRNDDDDGHKSGPPVDEEHDHDTYHSSYQGHPHVIVLEGGSPSWGLAKRSCKHGIVNEGVGHKEEV